MIKWTKFRVDTKARVVRRVVVYSEERVVGKQLGTHACNAIAGATERCNLSVLSTRWIGDLPVYGFGVILFGLSRSARASCVISHRIRRATRWMRRSATVQRQSARYVFLWAPSTKASLD